MTGWRMARSLDVALNEVNRAAPHRSKASDGGIGDAAHASRASDHNPWLNNTVRARDFTNDPAGGFSAASFAAHVAGLLGKHPALGAGAYVIWNRRIISTNHLSEGWRTYTGTNPHTKHVHVSVGLSGYDSTAPWGWPDNGKDQWDTMATKQELREVLEAALAPLEKKLDRELGRDKNVKARDRKRHQRIMAALEGVSAEVRNEVAAALEEADQ